MSKIIGLDYRMYVALGRLIAGCEVDPKTRRHFEVKGWFRNGKLTDDGRYVWRRALQDPPLPPGADLPAVVDPRQAAGKSAST